MSAIGWPLLASVLVLLGVGGTGSAQNTVGNSAGGAIGPSPPGAPAPPSSQTAGPVGLAAAPPPEAAPPASSEGATATNMDNTEAADDHAASGDAAAILPRPRYATAVFQALDKVTAETLRFEARVGEPVRYKDLVITVHACETNALNEAPADAIAHVDVQYQPAVVGGGAPVVRQVFRGWMFADSPGLHPFANPIYDVWVIACKTPAPAPAAVSGPSTPPGGASL